MMILIEFNKFFMKCYNVFWILILFFCFKDFIRIIVKIILMSKLILVIINIMLFLMGCG